MSIPRASRTTGPLGWVRCAALLPLLLTGACQSESTPGTVSTTGPIAEARTLMAQGQLDAALAKLQEMPNDPESILVQGQVWAKKAELAPPPEPPEDGGPAPEFKLEERNALAFFETLTEAMPEHAEAHLAIAALLRPHALARLEASRGRRGQPPAADPAAPDYSPERIKREYQAALAADGSAPPVEALIDFCVAVEDIECAEQALRQLGERLPESAVPYVRLGDFLRDVRKDDDGAIQQYDVALIWAPDDVTTKGKVADLYLDRAEAQLGERRWALADQALKSAAKYVEGLPERARRARELTDVLVRESGRRF